MCHFGDELLRRDRTRQGTNSKWIECVHEYLKILRFTQGYEMPMYQTASLFICVQSHIESQSCAIDGLSS